MSIELPSGLRAFENYAIGRGDEVRVFGLIALPKRLTVFASNHRQSLIYTHIDPTSLGQFFPLEVRLVFISIPPHFPSS